jgi:hypothetical protein
MGEGNGLKNLSFFLVVELFINGTRFEPNYFTSLKINFDISERITLPLRYCDLGIISLIGITIYDMSRPYQESVVASTTIDLFDYEHRLRQGTFNL